MRHALKTLRTEAPEDREDLESLVGYALKRAYVTMQADFRATLGEGGLTPRSFAAQSLVVQVPDITQSELARLLGIERSGLVAIIDDLEGRGYLRRTTVPGDRRVQALVPTEAGCAAYDEALTAVRAHEDKLLAGLSGAERDTLMTLLQKIRAAGGEN